VLFDGHGRTLPDPAQVHRSSVVANALPVSRLGHGLRVGQHPRMAKKQPLDRIRAIIASLPETSEKLSHGAPTWWGGKKTFAMYHSGNYDEGRRGVWIKADDGVQESLVESDPDRFYRPKYVGPSGWVGVRLEGEVSWEEVRFLLVDGYRLVAPKRALEALDERT
jgi:hypothetical protein